MAKISMKRTDFPLLRLTLHREFFAQIAAGTKRVEYRERSQYWKARLEGRRFQAILFRNGYSRNAPEMKVEFRGMRRGKNTYEILLGRILSVKRWKQKKVRKCKR